MSRVDDTGRCCPAEDKRILHLHLHPYLCGVFVDALVLLRGCAHDATCADRLQQPCLEPS